MPGHRYDTVGVAPLIEGVRFDALLADKAYDSNWIIEKLNERGAKVVVSQRPQRKQPLAIDEVMYGWRHLVENYFCKLKEFKRIAFRGCCNLTSGISFGACAMSPDWGVSRSGPSILVFHGAATRPWRSANGRT